MNAPPGLIQKDFVLTSEAIPKFEACPGSTCFIAEERPKTTFPQWHGIFVHRFLEYCVDRGHQQALDWIRTKKMKATVACCEAINPDHLLYGQTEIGWCHDPFEHFSRRVPFSLMATRDPRTEQFGKADIVVEHDVIRPLIGDYKTGKLKIEPAESTQLLGLAASYQAETAHKGSVDVALIEVKQSGELVWHVQEVDPPAIARYVDRAKRLHLRVLEDRERAKAGAWPEFVRNDQCQNCNLKPSCPAWT